MRAGALPPDGLGRNVSSEANHPEQRGGKYGEPTGRVYAAGEATYVIAQEASAGDAADSGKLAGGI
jgi:hypothetical protein